MHMTMRNKQATIQRTLVLSLAAHAALFGTAFAFAQYGGGSFRTERPVIVVSLVSEGAGAGATARMERRGADVRPETGRTMTAPVLDAEQTIPLMPEVNGPVRESVPQDHQDHGQANVRASGGPDLSGSGTTEGPAAGIPDGRFFGYSSDEWQLLRSSLERAKTYPRLARERGIEGTVLVRFRASPSGNIELVDIVKSSGARILDDATISTIYRAAPVPYVDGWVEVPMVYRLEHAEE